MLELRLGRLLDLHQTLVVERGFFQRAERELESKNAGHAQIDAGQYNHLRAAIVAVEQICRDASLTSTQQAAARTKRALENAERVLNENNMLGMVLNADGCRAFFHHLMDITSRIRDDCESRIYFQVSPEDASLLDPNADHFGLEVRKAFGSTVEDIAEAASCLALERPTACVFHLMRALEAAAVVVANQIGATIADKHGRTLPWGVIASNMKSEIDKMQKGSDIQIQWYRAQSFLEVVGRAWRNPSAHPKQTYTIEEAKNVFAATKSFMQELAPLA